MSTQLILPCIRSIMGDWITYSSSMSIKELSDRVVTDKKYREDPILDNILQRDLKERRTKIAQYLVSNPSRFFNSVIIGVFNGVPQWHEFEIHNKIKELAGEAFSDDYTHNVGLLQFTGDEEMFAVDGQHRVAGMQIAHAEEMVKPEEERILSDDKFPVIFIAHIDDALGKKRTRKLFSDINKNAVGVSAGDRIKIDEESLTAIVTRRLYTSYAPFKKGTIISLTESEKLDLNDTTHFTNLLGINGVLQVLKKLYKIKPGTLEWSEENIAAFYIVAEGFFNYIIEVLDDYKSYFVEDDFDLATARSQNKNLLFRPVGLKVIAGLYAHFFNKQNGLQKLRQKLPKLSFNMPDSPFNNILWYDGKMKAREYNQVLALELSIYLIGDITPIQKDKLLEKYKGMLENKRARLPKKI